MKVLEGLNKKTKGQSKRCNTTPMEYAPDSTLFCQKENRTVVATLPNLYTCKYV